MQGYNEITEQGGVLMEWLDSIRKAITFMEEHLLEDISAQDVAKQVCMSPFYLQHGFKLMTGYTLGEYIRCRRLYLAAIDAAEGKAKVIDLAYRYGYDTPESFTKAFKRFHGATPMQIRGNTRLINVFLPLKISITLQGGANMEYKVEKMKGFKVIGFARKFSFESSYSEIPSYWNEIFEKYEKPLFKGKKPESEIEKAMCDNMVGEYGVCIDDIGEDGFFNYMVAGEYRGGPVPEGMTVYEFPELEWAKFRCVGPLPGALQAVNTKIFSEWLPENGEYEIAIGANIEWYSPEGSTSDTDYVSEVWIPVKRK